MASTILRNLHNKPGSGSNNNTNNGDMMSQFMKFKKDIEASGKDPQSMLNELLASGRVPPAMLNKAKSLAAVFANKFKSGR
ncbi:MAG: hypothetical protein K6D95_04610 [Treponema sp.]|nr:hypothetical protein [Treponema sp.]